MATAKASKIPITTQPSIGLPARRHSSLSLATEKALREALHLSAVPKLDLAETCKYSERSGQGTSVTKSGAFSLTEVAEAGTRTRLRDLLKQRLRTLSDVLGEHSHSNRYSTLTRFQH